MILYVEHTVDANDLPTALWRFCNNLDPKRDSHISKQPLKPQTSNSNYTLVSVSMEHEKQKSWMISIVTGQI